MSTYILQLHCQTKAGSTMLRMAFLETATTQYIWEAYSRWKDMPQDGLSALHDYFSRAVAQLGEHERSNDGTLIFRDVEYGKIVNAQHVLWVDLADTLLHLGIKKAVAKGHEEHLVHVPAHKVEKAKA